MLDTICLEMSNVDTSIEDILLAYKRGVNADEVFAAIYPRVKDSAEKVYYTYARYVMPHDEFTAYMLEVLFDCMNRFDKATKCKFQTYYLTSLRNKVFYHKRNATRANGRFANIDDYAMFLEDEDSSIEKALEKNPEYSDKMTEMELINSFDTENEKKIVAYILETGVAPSRRNKDYYKMGMMQKDFILAMRSIKDRYRETNYEK